MILPPLSKALSTKSILLLADISPLLFKEFVFNTISFKTLIEPKLSILSVAFTEIVPA